MREAKSDQTRAKPPTRYTLLLEEDAVETLDHLQKEYGLRSRAAVFDLAVTFLAWAAAERAAGYRIGRRADNGEFHELLLSGPRARKPSLAAVNGETVLQP